MAYDECGRLENYKKFASVAARELLGKEPSRPYVKRIEEAKSQAEISRIMTSVRYAI